MTTGRYARGRIASSVGVGVSPGVGDGVGEGVGVTGALDTVITNGPAPRTLPTRSIASTRT